MTTSSTASAITLSSYVGDRWITAPDSADFATAVDPSTEQPVARVSSAGVDFQAIVDYARQVGGPALRDMSFAERGELIKSLSKALRAHRDELLELSSTSTGTTTADGSFDIDGATGVLAYYALQGRKLGDRKVMPSGDGAQLSKTEGFWVQHAWVPKHGVAVAINAFNFPVWGLAEKLACAILAGVPVIAKPATATALLTHRSVEIMLEAGVLPAGALQLVCGSTGDLLDRMTSQDVLAFTGSADTALKLRGKKSLLSASVAINIEADSLNAAVLGPDVEPDSATWKLFIREVAREMTQKTGQKCTAIRRILVPEATIDAVQEALIARLGRVVTGNPADESVKMGPLASAQQLADAERGVRELTASAQIVHGEGVRVDGTGSPSGKGFFFAPTLLRADDAKASSVIHEREVFAPVSTLLPYSGDAAEAGEIVALGGGTLVTAAYSDDAQWLGNLANSVGAHTGRLYVGSEGSADVSYGSGAALPQANHGGPGRAGGGSELGGLEGLHLYMQRVAMQGDRTLVEPLAGVETGD